LHKYRRKSWSSCFAGRHLVKPELQISVKFCRKVLRVPGLPVPAQLVRRRAGG
jgi:hypothetical protein